MIPKIIHYCWLSDDPMPKDILGYMSTWQKHLKDYEFIKWDFNRFPKDKSDWVREAFECKKYAFAADYLRLFALYNYGGIYLDSDVEVLKSFDKFLSLDTMMCYENTSGTNNSTFYLEVAAFGVSKGQKWIGDCLKHYEGRHFLKDNGEMDMLPLPEVVWKVLSNDGYVLKDVQNVSEAQSVKEKEIPVFPFDYFSPKNLYSMEVTVTDNTYSIHNYKGSWAPQRLRNIFLGMGFKYKTAMALAHYVGFPWRMVKPVLQKAKVIR
jgi:hypothetical protein